MSPTATKRVDSKTLNKGSSPPLLPERSQIHCRRGGGLLLQLRRASNQKDEGPNGCLLVGQSSSLQCRCIGVVTLFMLLGLDCENWTEPIYADLVRLAGLVHYLQVRRKHL